MTTSSSGAFCPEGFIALGRQLAAAAGDVARHYFRTAVDVDDKPDSSPVTRADREAETKMRELIAAAHPDHGVVGEEHGSDRPDAEFVWALDPIDGTKHFITGNPLFGSLIALLQGGRPILGIIDLPVLGESWIGAAGRATRFQDRRGEREARVRPCARLDQAILTASSPHMFSDREFPAFERVRKAAKMVLYGGDCFSYGTLASGLSDLAIEADMGVYDFLALVPVVTGAGGIMTDWSGGPLGLETDGRVIAAGDQRVHEAALELLNYG